MVFLFARKLDIKRTVDLLTSYKVRNHLKILKFINKIFVKNWRKEIGIENRVKFSEVNIEILKSQYAWNIHGMRDKEGRGIVYFLPSRFKPAGYTIDEMLKHALWTFEWSVNRET